MKRWLTQKVCLLWMRLYIVNWTWNLKRLMWSIRAMEPGSRGQMITKWRWQASRIADVEFRESMLDLVDRFEKSLK